MTPETLEALKASIAKWERNAVAEWPDEAHIRGNSCPLCAIFAAGDNECVGCPVSDRTGQSDCDGSPWEQAFWALRRWQDDHDRRSQFHAAAREESRLPQEPSSSRRGGGVMGHRNHWICTVPGCGKPHDARGLCNMHLKRQRKDNNWKPLPHPTPAYEFLHSVVLTHEGDDCLTWPYAVNTTGYGAIRINGRNKNVSRYVCELKHGAPPIGRPLAAHSCGNGHLACVNWRHLRWASYQENRDDAQGHGTVPKGEASPSAKLTLEQVREIRALRGKLSQSKLSRIYGVHPSQISVVQRGISWAHIPLDGDV